MGNNLLSKIIIARVVKYFVKPPGQYKKLLPSWLLVKIVRICYSVEITEFYCHQLFAEISWNQLFH